MPSPPLALLYLEPRRSASHDDPSLSHAGRPAMTALHAGGGSTVGDALILQRELTQRNINFQKKISHFEVKN